MLARTAWCGIGCMVMLWHRTHGHAVSLHACVQGSATIGVVKGCSYAMHLHGGFRVLPSGM
eukprot:365108-Chlamydomonas_euryale.AAC.4